MQKQRLKETKCGHIQCFKCLHKWLYSMPYGNVCTNRR
ncbi:MAG: hypothetical protein K2P10_01780 [Oscillospiraceae bacterium]|nr:hypothetical protein [Oscillospiraceae bacterium]